MIKIKTSQDHKNITIIDDAESTPGMSRQLSIAKMKKQDWFKLLEEKKMQLLFQIDTDATYRRVFAPEFKLINTTVDENGDTIREFEFIGE